MTQNFHIEKARKAQEDYCEKHGCPMFAPRNGNCPRCGYNIFLPINGSRSTIYGITVEEAGNKLITSCPFCNTTFVD